MKIHFSNLGSYTLVLVMLWQVTSRIFDHSYLSYLIFSITFTTLLLRGLSRKKLPQQVITAFWLVFLLFIIAAWSLKYSHNFNWSAYSLVVFTFRLMIIMLAAIIASEYGPESILDKMDLIWYMTLLVIAAWLTPGFFNYFDLSVNYQNAGASIMLCILPILIFQKKYFKATISIVLALLLGSRMAVALILLFLIFYIIFYIVKLKMFLVIAILAVLLVFSTSIYYLDGNNYIGDYIESYNPVDLPDKDEFDRGRKIHNYHGISLTKQHWLRGIGIGTFQLQLFELSGREMSPHNFIFFFLLQMGIFSLIVYLILVYYSIKPLWKGDINSQNKMNVFAAVGMSNLLSFGYFFTRPQLDNIIYFMMIGVAIGMTQRRRHNI